MKLNSKKTVIDRSDFDSYVEIGKRTPMVYYDENNLGNYGCSFFITLDEIHRCTKFPTRNKAIANIFLY